MLRFFNKYVLKRIYRNMSCILDKHGHLSLGQMAKKYIHTTEGKCLI